ncbi:MAG: glycoside hydrolase family 172 protein [Candidatus Zipacnadales bacterium]
MKTYRATIGLLTLTAGLLVGGMTVAQTVTVESLLGEMVDLARLARLPEPPYESDQWSSYDRASVVPDQEGWFANGDAGQFIREETHNGRKEFVMAEMDGPGVICRIWSANPEGGGTIRIYIDDMQTPALEADFLALTSAQLPEFPAPFSGRRSRGANLYFPIPYQTTCKCTVDKPSLYYHIGYRTYPAGTSVEPFRLAVLPQVKAKMEEVGRILAHPERRFTTDGATRIGDEWAIVPGEEKALLLRGPGAIVRLEMTILVPENQLFAALRESLLTIYFDSEKTPCVWVPLGDFFGSTPGLNPHRSLPVGMDEDGECYCNWVMPYRRSAEVRIKNESANPVKLRLALWTKALEFVPGRSLYFHAKWRNEWLPSEPQFVDWRMLDATGPGRFVGVMLGVVNTQQGWWGEGDEKVWVDDDTFPSYFGTGSEDYFGYAWCNPDLFTHAYHNQSIVTGPGNFGYTAVARYHVLDDIPFRKSIKFDIEKWGGADREYCCTTYWYAAPGTTDFFKPIKVADRRVRPLPELFKVKDGLEGEELMIVRCTGGTTEIQGLTNEFSGQRHLWWRNPAVGDVLEVKLPVERAGRYMLTVGLTKSWDYGIHQLMINGQEVGEPLDLYTPPPYRPFKVELGPVDLKAGDNLLGLRCVGTNPQANPVAHMAGLDYVVLTPVKE